MSDPKPFASLGPTLLARKGAARPAMRPQVQPFTTFERQAAQQMDDLGWNDMGDAHDDPHAGPEPLPLAPAAAPAGFEAEEFADEAPEAEKPVVRRQQEEIARKVASAHLPEPAKARPTGSRRKSALEEGRRAAFTLRVDAERHLKLRLACTIRNLSAQQIVTEALDRLLADIPELETLAAQVKRT